MYHFERITRHLGIMAYKAYILGLRVTVSTILDLLAVGIVWKIFWPIIPTLARGYHTGFALCRPTDGRARATIGGLMKFQHDMKYRASLDGVVQL